MIQQSVREFQERTDLFVDELDVDVLLAQFLASEGFLSIEDVAYTDAEDFKNIEGLDENIAAELQERAVAIEQKKKLMLDDLGVSKALREMQGLTVDMLIDLAKEGVKSLEDFAGLTADELVVVETGEEAETEEGDEAEASEPEETPFLAGYDLTEQVNKMIMAARKAMGWI